MRIILKQNELRILKIVNEFYMSKKDMFFDNLITSACISNNYVTKLKRKFIHLQNEKHVANSHFYFSFFYVLYSSVS
jgi:hypothetical protein